MTSWRRLVLDIMEGRVPESGPSVREAICECQHEPPAQRSGTFGETVKNMALAEARAKTPCAKIFERLVFGHKRGGRGWNHEEDTREEGRIRNSVEDWISGGAQNKQAIRDFEKIKKCAEKYPDEFKPTVEEIWRGIGTGIDRVSKWVSLKKFMESEDVLKIGSLTYVGVPVQYKPGKPIESWAAEPAVAGRFAVDNSGRPSSPNARDIRYVEEMLREYIRFKEGKRSEDYDERHHLSDMRDAIKYAYSDMMMETLPVVFRIKTDKNSVFSEWFANALGNHIGVGRETEVTRVVTGGAAVRGTIYIPKAIVDNMIRYENTMEKVVENIPKLKNIPRIG